MSGEWEKGDEPINVVLPRRDYERLRKILQREASIGWVTKWLMTIGFTFVGGVLTVSIFIERFKVWGTHFFKINPGG